MALIPGLIAAAAPVLIYPVFTYLPKPADSEVEVRYEHQQSIMFMNGPTGSGTVPIVFTHLVPIREEKEERPELGSLLRKESGAEASTARRAGSLFRMLRGQDKEGK
jgi:hypothetical protein